MKKMVYIICPVRNITKEAKEELDDYVDFLESSGDYICHYPPRDVDQSIDEYNICDLHRTAMLKCDEVHIWWEERLKSMGSHFDLGMAFVLKKKIYLINEVPSTESKSYSNVLNTIDNM